jgi:glyoxylase-like metal-dependent hydrolase (beta-lactamase superfamily II)
MPAGAAELKEKLGDIPIEGPHQADKFLLDGLVAQGLAMGLAGARNVTPDRWLAEGDTVSAAAATFAVLLLPRPFAGLGGAGQCRAALRARRRRAVRGSIGRTDFPYGDHAALIDAIKTKLLPLGDDLVFICGHGPMSTIGEERQSNPFLA